MFKIEKQLSVQWPVLIGIPRDGGGISKARISAQFELLPNSEFQAIYSNGGNDEDLLRRVLLGWSDVADADGNPLAFGSETRETLIQITYVRSALVAAYMECCSGREAARKN